jgi:putative ABC transport system permease protein
MSVERRNRRHRFSPSHLTHNPLAIYLPDSRYGDETKCKLFFDSLLNHLRQRPGLVDAGIDDHLPFGGNATLNVFGIPREEYHELTQMPAAETQRVSQGCFRSLEIPLIRGRLFDDTDQPGAEKVAIINQAIAQRFFPKQDPIGKQILRPRPKPEAYTIVGVVSNIQQRNPEFQRTVFQVYYPFSQSPENYATVVIRTAGDPRSFIPSLQETVSELDSNLPLSNVRNFDEVIAKSFNARRLSVLVADLLSGAALLLAAAGLYAVLSYIVIQRTREIGVRVALGARSTNILRLVLTRGLVIVGFGLLAGFVATLGLVPLVQASLYGISAYDPAAMLAGIMVLSLTAVAACLVPAVRATRVNPITALRE